MSRRFYLGLVLLLGINLFLHLNLIKNHNFYFTIDQARDGVMVREIVEQRKIIWKGPETSLPGIHTGPLWYYFLVPFYRVFRMDPVGGVWAMMLVNILTVGGVMMITKNLFLGTLLMRSWKFFETATYSFNPFPLVILAFGLIYFLAKFWERERKYYFWGAGVIILGFNTQISGSVAFLLFYLAVGVWALIKGRISNKNLTYALAVIFLATVVIVAEMVNGLVASKIQNTATGNFQTFVGTNWREVLSGFGRLVADGVIPQNITLSAILLMVVAYLYFKKARRDFNFRFITLTICLLAISFLFFASNRGWRDWHTIYLTPLLYVALLLMIFKIKNKFKYVLLGVLIISQMVLFYNRYSEGLKPSENPGLLSNQLKVIDWIYKNAEGDGFSAYSFSPVSFYDYQQQYLFWWYGKKTYGFVPCEYAPYKKFQKQFYIPSYLEFSSPQKGCDRFRFLIIEEGENGEHFRQWEEKVKRLETELLEETGIAGYKIEKRKNSLF